MSALAEAGADVNARDVCGMTPLMHAARGDHEAAAAALLGAGALPRVKDIVSSLAATAAVQAAPCLRLLDTTSPQSGATAEMHALRCNARATASAIQVWRPPTGN